MYALVFKFVDVFRCHNLGWSKHDLARRSNRVFAKATSLEFLAFLASYFAHSELLSSEIRQISKIGDIPPNVLNTTIHDIFLDQRSWGQTSQFDFTKSARLLERTRCCR